MGMLTYPLTGLMIVSILALLLELVGYATPGWFVFDLTSGSRVGSSLNMSLLYVIACPSAQDGCKFMAHNDINKTLSSFGPVEYQTHVNHLMIETDDELYWLAWSIVATLSLLLCLIGMILAVHAFCKESSKERSGTNLTLAASAVLLVAGISGWITSGMAYNAYFKIRDMYQRADDSVQVRVPWSLALFSCGALLALLAVIIVLVIQCMFSSSEEEHRGSSRSTRGGGGDVVRVENAVVDVYLNEQHEIVPPVAISPPPYSSHAPSASGRKFGFSYTPQAQTPSRSNTQFEPAATNLPRDKDETVAKSGRHGGSERHDGSRLLATREEPSYQGYINRLPVVDEARGNDETASNSTELQRLHEDIDEIYSTRLPEYRRERR